MIGVSIVSLKWHAAHAHLSLHIHHLFLQLHSEGLIVLHIVSSSSLDLFRLNSELKEHLILFLGIVNHHLHGHLLLISHRSARAGTHTLRLHLLHLFLGLFHLQIESFFDKLFGDGGLLFGSSFRVGHLTFLSSHKHHLGLRVLCH